MLHSLRMLIVRDCYSENAMQAGTGWNIAKDCSCAVWDRGFLKFLESLDELPDILDRLNKL